jgi:hypothetical protein
MPVRNAMAQAIIDALNAGTGAAVLEFYTATMPSTPDVAITSQVKLGSLVCSDPAATVTDGVITFAAITQDSSADATGDATWVRIFDSSGAAVTDMDVTDEAGSGAIKINTVHIVMGGPILMNSQTITVG